MSDITDDFDAIDKILQEDQAMTPKPRRKKKPEETVKQALDRVDREIAEKRYTVKELLGSEEAMDELLHIRTIAVRDDLMGFINANDGRLARTLTDQQTRQYAALVSGVEKQLSRLEALLTKQNAQIQQFLDREPWWRRYWRFLTFRN